MIIICIQMGSSTSLKLSLILLSQPSVLFSLIPTHLSMLCGRYTHSSFYQIIYVFQIHQIVYFIKLFNFIYLYDFFGQIARELLEPIIEPDSVKKHPVSQLHEVCQKKKFKLQFVDLWKESTSIDVFINQKFVARGSYSSKKDIARYRAAKNALDNIDKVLSITTTAENDAIED